MSKINFFFGDAASATISTLFAGLILVWISLKLRRLFFQHGSRSRGHTHSHGNAPESSDPLVVADVVLGDFGRSPRMQYHCKSLLDNSYKFPGGVEVHLLGFFDSTCIDQIEKSPRVVKHSIKTPFLLRWMEKTFVTRAILKVVFQTLRLFFVLMTISKLQFILVQNPPGIPLLLICHVVCFLRGCRLIIDWHNFGYTILALARKNFVGQLAVKVYRWYERVFGRGAYANLCVTEGMKDFLQTQWKIQNVSVLYDKAPSFFSSSVLIEKHALFWRLREVWDKFKRFWESDIPDCTEITPFTMKYKDSVVYRKDRFALLLSSTSWTEDEDFSILIKAANLYQELVNKSKTPCTKIVLAVTGKGPLKQFYERQMQEMKNSHIVLTTLWLETPDYPKFVGSCDLGVCLHNSSSKLDLPMKVVDMFGCSVPVCAVGYQCLPELVKNGENGLIFSTAEELAQQIFDLVGISPFENSDSHLNRLRTGVENFAKERGSWEQNWNQIALPLFQNKSRKD